MPSQWPTVEKLAEQMHKNLNAHKGENPAGWENVREGFLLNRLADELEEFREVAITGSSPERLWSEAADAANFLMMLCDNYERAYEEAQP